MKKRMFIMLAAVFAFVAIIGGFKFFQIKAAIAQGKKYQPPPEAVTTIVAQPQEWDTTLNAIGSVQAVNGVTVSADLPGVVESIHFASGQNVTTGDVLVRLDMKQERAQLAAADAQRDLAKVSLDRSQGMLAKGVVPQQTFDQSAAEFKSADARVGEIKATIDRKTIRAPFTGVLGIRQVNVGQYVAGGAPIVSLQSIRPAYVNFTVPQQEMAEIAPGATVQVKSDALPQPEVARVAAVDSVIDEATRNVRVQATAANTSGHLRAGMYVEVQLPHGTKQPVVPMPASAISYAPFGDSVYIVDSTGHVRQQFVKLGAAHGDQVAILTGVKAGDVVVTSGVFKLRPGAAVTVNNSIQPANSTAPKPEDS